MLCSSLAFLAIPIPSLYLPIHFATIATSELRWDSPIISDLTFRNLLKNVQLTSCPILMILLKIVWNNRMNFEKSTSERSINAQQNNWLEHLISVKNIHSDYVFTWVKNVSLMIRNEENSINFACVPSWKWIRIQIAC